MKVKKTSAVGQDLVFGLIVPIGADRDLVIKALRNELTSFKYNVPDPIKLSDKIPRYVGAFPERESLLQITKDPRFKNSLERKDLLMRAGNAIREQQGIEEAVAMIAVVAIQEQRDALVKDGRVEKQNRMHTHTAFIIDSLKHPAEVERLRSIYGPSFVAIGIYEPPEVRERKLQKSISQTGKVKYDLVRDLMERDEDEHRDFGQRLRKAFELSDVVVDTSRKNDVRDQISRVIQLLFGYPYLTPTKQEYGMFLARAAQARSGSMARQVGAAVLREEGSVAAVGTNEVARPFGGQYWECDDKTYEKGRDFHRDRDSSDYFRQRAIVDFLKRLRDAKYLDATLNNKEPEELLDILFFGSGEQENKQSVATQREIADSKLPHKAVLKGAFLTGTIDYVRAVHAEMAAITDAARNGIELSGCTMYTTTFPCHDCAKHIVASGLKELIYFEAYPKSLVADLYDDSIDINKQRPEKDLKVHFHSFVGIAPSRYLDFFAMSMDRKTTRGEPVDFNAAVATLRLPQYAPTPRAISVAETDAVSAFLERAPRQVPLPLTNKAHANSRKKQPQKKAPHRKAAVSKGNKR